MSTVKKWFSLRDAVSKHNVKVWLPLVKDMKWSDVNTKFTAAFSEQWQVDDEETAINQLDPYEKHIQDTDITLLSTYTPNMSNANMKAIAKNKAKTLVVKNTAKKMEHRDSNKGKKYKAQEEFLVNMVKDWWEIGYPVGKLELYGKLGARDDCANGTDFHYNYLDPMK